ncbi:MAG: electron transfer flavoprotein subunit beta/FixA family protein [Planctomycetota bacterium]
MVCIKRVPDTETRVKIGTDGKSLDTGGVQFIMAPYDEIAVEKAIQMKEAAGSGTVTVLTVGPAEATKELRTALAMGADAAIHAVTTDAFDAAATARALKGALADRAYDLILCGKQATDADDAAVGPMLAALLDLPCVAFAEVIEAQDGTLEVRREIEGETDVFEVTPPCVLTAQKGLAEPRYPGLKGIMAAKKKPLETAEVSGDASASEVVKLELPPARSEVTHLDPTPEGMEALLTALRNEKKVL